MDAEFQAPETKPLLLLDVDGVLNPFGPRACPPGYTEHHIFAGEEPVRLCSAHGRWIRELGTVFDVVWATGWGGDANRYLCPIYGLPRFPFVPFPRIPFAPDDKVPAIDEFVADRRALWIDDCLTPRAWAWARNRPDRRELVPVDAATGWTGDAVGHALAWASIG